MQVLAALPPGAHHQALQLAKALQLPDKRPSLVVCSVVVASVQALQSCLVQLRKNSSSPVSPLTSDTPWEPADPSTYKFMLC